MKFTKIETPTRGISTLRVETLSFEFFRPAATGLDHDLLHTKLEMEALEIAASKEQPLGFVSCAAHYDKPQAVKNACIEAVERISLSSWWSRDLPFIGKLDGDQTEELLQEFFEDDDNFSVEIGFVRPIIPKGVLAVSVLENSQEYPFIVLGSKYSETKHAAVEGAFFESIQSWAASQWLKENHSGQAPMWDIGTLRSRKKTLSEESCSIPDLDSYPKGEFHIDNLFDDACIVTKKYDRGWVAWVYPSTEKVGERSFELAKLDDVNSDKPIKVFTQHNW